MTVLIHYNGETRHFNLEGDIIEFTLNGARDFDTKVILSHLNEITISEKEMRILKLTAQGKTSIQIASATKYSSRTVESIKDKLRDKFGYATVMEMIVDFVRKKIL